MILLNEDSHPQKDHAEIAREITWLASCLVPGTGKEADKYLKRLSYGVYSHENISIVNLAYSTDQTIHDDYFELNSTDRAERPELYQILAEKALQSQQEYQMFIQQLLNEGSENGVNADDFRAMYALWKLNHKQQISHKEFPFAIEKMLSNAAKDQNAWEKCINYNTLVDDMKINYIILAWNGMLKLAAEDTSGMKTEDICRAAVRIFPNDV